MPWVSSGRHRGDSSQPRTGDVLAMYQPAELRLNCRLPVPASPMLDRITDLAAVLNRRPARVLSARLDGGLAGARLCPAAGVVIIRISLISATY